MIAPLSKLHHIPIVLATGTNQTIMYNKRSEVYTHLSITIKRIYYESILTATYTHKCTYFTHSLIHTNSTQEAY